ncbi:reverse transcriptase domain-containing protein [Tanacetum coccineum]
MSIPHNNMGPPPAGPLPPNNTGSPPMGDDANRHIDKFLEITQHMKQNGVSDDALRLSLFPYSLTHHAIAWYDRLPRNSIHSFKEMMRKFLSKYFPPSMVTKLRNEIMKFEQKPHESLFGLGSVINAGGTFMQKTPEECYELIENMTAHHNHWDTSATRDETSRNISSTSTTERVWKAITTRSGVAYDGPTIPPTPSPLPKEVERETEATKDKVQNTSLGSTAHVQPPDVQDPIPEPGVALKPKPKPLHFDISFTDALLHMPKFASTFKSLISNKEKLFELAKTPLNENCSAVLLKKLHDKLGDPGKFLIPCDFPELDECLALANLATSINLMPLSVWKQLSLPELTSTHMTLELADRSTVHPKGVAEDVFVKVGKFYFLADFVVVDYDVDPRVPLILGRPFLRTARALIDVYGEELTLRVDDEAITFKVGQTSRDSCSYETVNQVNVIDIACEEYAQEVLGFSDSSSSGNPTPSDPIIASSSPSFTPFEGGDFILEEIETFLHTPDELSNLDDDYYDTEGDILYLEKLLNEDPSLFIPQMKNDELSKLMLL